MILRGQAPERGQSGGFLNKQSTSGKKVSFVVQSNLAEGSITLSNSGGSTSYGYFRVGLTATVNGKTVSHDEMVAWHYADFYINVNNSSASLWPDGIFIDADEAKLELYHYNRLSTGSSSHASYYAWKNPDTVNGHTIYLTSQWKLILTEDVA